MRTDHVRPFVEADIPQVASLHAATVSAGGDVSAAAPEWPHDYFRRIFLHNPCSDPALPSLVYEDDEHRVVGFLGVMPRGMSLDGEPLKAAVGSQFIVDPTARSAQVAVQLAATFLDGRQDVSICDDANDVSRTIWEGLGGTTAMLHSLYWIRPLRPVRYIVSCLRRRRRGPLAAVADTLLHVVDFCAVRGPRGDFFQARPTEGSYELYTDTFVTRLPEFTDGALHVEYDDTMFEWLLERARQRRSVGMIRKAVVKRDQSVKGWYLYHLNPGGVADVLQIAAKPSSIDDVLDHLFYEAWSHGAIAVTGRVEPRFLQAFSNKHCFFHRRGPWMLVSSRRPELLRAFQNGNAFFSRFDGEWCLGLQPDGPLTWCMQ